MWPNWCLNFMYILSSALYIIWKFKKCSNQLTLFKHYQKFVIVYNSILVTFATKIWSLTQFCTLSICVHTFLVDIRLGWRCMNFRNTLAYQLKGFKKSILSNYNMKLCKLLKMCSLVCHMFPKTFVPMSLFQYHKA